MSDGMLSVRGVPSSAVPISKVIQAALPTFAKPGVAPPDFEATVYHHQPTVTYTSAVHVAVVDVDPDTGAVKLLRYVVAHDCGTVINPVIVEGQIHGGVAQGVGGGLLEEREEGHRRGRHRPRCGRWGAAPPRPAVPLFRESHSVIRALATRVRH